MNPNDAPFPECAVHSTQIEDIASDVKEIKGDIKTAIPAIAVLAKTVGTLETRMDHVESQMNWGKWLGGIAAVVAAVVAFLRGGA